MSESRALVVHRDALPPFELLHRFAQAMADSSLVPESLCIDKDKKPLPPARVVANCMLVADLAYRWEMSPFAVGQCVAIVHGKVCVEGKLVHAVLEAKLGVRLGYKFNEAQGRDLGIVVSGTLPGESEPRTIEGAVAQWHTGDKGPWGLAANWKRQLRYRGAREWARAHAPGVLLGVYTPDEMDEASEPRDITPMVPLAPPPDIPDSPPPGEPVLASAPPAVPDVPDVPHDPVTGEVLPSDAEFLAGLEGLLNQCASDAEVGKCAADNAAEVAERGLEQAASDLYEKRRQRMREVQAEAKAEAARDRAAKTPEQLVQEQEYIRILKAIRSIGVNGTLAHLQKLWTGQQRELQALPEAWRAQLTAEKDKVKAQLQQKEAA